MIIEVENLTRDEKIGFLQNPVWGMFRESLFERKQELYEKIISEGSRVQEVKMSADKLAILDEIFEAEKELIESLKSKGELQ